MIIQDDDDSNMFSGGHNTQHLAGDKLFKENKELMPNINSEEY